MSLCRHGLPPRRCGDCSPDLPTGGAVVWAAVAWFVVLVALAWWAVQ